MSGDDIIDAEWEEVPDPESSLSTARHNQQPKLHRVAAAPPPVGDDDVSPWRDKAFLYDLGKAILIGSRRLTLAVFGILAVGFLLFAWSGGINETKSDPVTSEQAGAEQDAEQMLRSWTKVVTGQADARGFAMIDGQGDPGDFCNNSDGDTLLRFGGKTIGNNPVINIYDFFTEFHATANSGVIGAFWYDHSNGSLLTRNQAAVSGDGKTDPSLPDVVHAFKVNADANGRATIDGTAYHVCLL